MGATWSGDPLSIKVNNAGNNALDKVIWAINNLANVILSNGALEMKQVIVTTPSSIIPGKPDRVDTTLMHDSVRSHSMERVSSNSHIYEGYAGWPPHEVKDYFLVQEYGGMSEGLFVGDRVITPMHALSKIYYSMLGDLQNGIRHLSA